MTESTLSETNFILPGQTNFYKGKVRDVYTVGQYLIMIVTDRISAFDVVLPRAIPFKGQVLNQIASRMLELTSDIVPNWLIDVPDPNVSVNAGRWRDLRLGPEAVFGRVDGLFETGIVDGPTGGADVVEDVAMLSTECVEKVFLERTHLRDINVVEIAAGAGVNRNNLLLNAKR